MPMPYSSSPPAAPAASTVCARCVDPAVVALARSEDVDNVLTVRLCAHHARVALQHLLSATTHGRPAPALAFAPIERMEARR